MGNLIYNYTFLQKEGSEGRGGSGTLETTPPPQAQVQPCAEDVQKVNNKSSLNVPQVCLSYAQEGFQGFWTPQTRFLQRHLVQITRGCSARRIVHHPKFCEPVIAHARFTTWPRSYLAVCCYWSNLTRVRRCSEPFVTSQLQ